jgi:hypothetical protein
MITEINRQVMKITFNVFEDYTNMTTFFGLSASFRHSTQIDFSMTQCKNCADCAADNEFSLHTSPTSPNFTFSTVSAENKEVSCNKFREQIRHLLDGRLETTRCKMYASKAGPNSFWVTVRFRTKRPRDLALELAGG